jgi:hypothetical protein
MLQMQPSRPHSSKLPKIRDRPRAAATRVEEIEPVDRLADPLEGEEPDCVNNSDERIEEIQPSPENSPEDNTGEWEEESIESFAEDVCSRKL